MALSLKTLRRGVVVLALAAILLALCGAVAARKGHAHRLHPVRGQVFVQREPAREAFVTFHPLHRAGPQKPTAFGRVEADGSFCLTTYSHGDGAAAGEYAVTVTWRTLDTDGEDIGPDRLRGRYADPQTSRLRVRVGEGTNELAAFQLLR